MSVLIKGPIKKYPLMGLLPILILCGCRVEGLNNLQANATAVSAGYQRTCALIPGGLVLRCWGMVPSSNTKTIVSTIPVPISGITNAVAISVSGGSGHTCVLITGGTIQCWGLNFYGQLGDGETAPSLGNPVSAIGITSAVAVSAGGNHTCALLSGRTAQCWGLNISGQLGNGTTTDSSVPVAVSGITTATAISAGSDDTCALLSGGTIQCWGANTYGQLGNGTTTDSSVPVAVSGITTATAISVGGDYACALLSGGTIQCWGINSAGQLGNGTLANSSAPAAVSGITNATAVSAGQSHACALLTTTAMECWGLNDAGQLGNGTPSGSSIPVTVADTIGSGSLSFVTAVSSGVDHTCALLSGGAVACWGLNNLGQVGDGLTTDSTLPVVVSGF